MTIYESDTLKANHNKEQNGLEISYKNEMTSEQITELKQSGFRWSRRNQVWYQKWNGDEQASSKQLINSLIEKDKVLYLSKENNNNKQLNPEQNDTLISNHTWIWLNYNEGFDYGCILAPNDEQYFNYDFETGEYQVSTGDDFKLLDEKDLTSNSFRSYAENYIINKYDPDAVFINVAGLDYATQKHDDILIERNLRTYFNENKIDLNSKGIKLFNPEEYGFEKDEKDDRLHVLVELSGNNEYLLKNSLSLFFILQNDIFTNSELMFNGKSVDYIPLSKFTFDEIDDDVGYGLITNTYLNKLKYFRGHLNYFNDFPLSNLQSIVSKKDFSKILSKYNNNITEYTHLWDNFAQVSFPKDWQSGLDIFSKTLLWDEVKKDHNYADNDNSILSECHARICREIAENVLQNRKDNNEYFSWKQEVMDYLDNYDIWKPDYLIDKPDSLTDGTPIPLINSMIPWLTSPFKDLISQRDISYKLNNFEKEQDIKTVSDESLLKEDVISILAENDIDLIPTNIKIYKPEEYGFEKDNKLHVLVEFSGSNKEDWLHDVLQQENSIFNGQSVDWNPISTDISGTITQYLENLKTDYQLAEKFNKYSNKDEQTYNEIAKNIFDLTKHNIAYDSFEDWKKEVFPQYATEFYEKWLDTLNPDGISYEINRTLSKDGNSHLLDFSEEEIRICNKETIESWENSKTENYVELYKVIAHDEGFVEIANNVWLESGEQILEDTKDFEPQEGKHSDYLNDNFNRSDIKDDQLYIVDNSGYFSAVDDKDIINIIKKEANFFFNGSDHQKPELFINQKESLNSNQNFKLISYEVNTDNSKVSYFNNYDEAEKAGEFYINERNKIYSETESAYAIFNTKENKIEKATEAFAVNKFFNEVQIKNSNFQTLYSNKSNSESIELTPEVLNLAKAVIPPMEYNTLLDNVKNSEEKAHFKSKLKQVANIVTQLQNNSDGKSYNPNTEQHDKGYIHYFFGSNDWYICELDKNSERGFGFSIINGDTQFAEFEYINLKEVTELSFNNGLLNVELDLYTDQSLTMEQAICKNYPELKNKLLSGISEDVEKEQNNSTELPVSDKNPLIFKYNIEDFTYALNQEDNILLTNIIKSNSDISKKFILNTNNLESDFLGYKDDFDELLKVNNIIPLFFRNNIEHIEPGIYEEHLFDSIYENDIESVKELLSDGANPLARSSYGNNAFQEFAADINLLDTDILLAINNSIAQDELELAYNTIESGFEQKQSALEIGKTIYLDILHDSDIDGLINTRKNLIFMGKLSGHETDIKNFLVTADEKIQGYQVNEFFSTPTNKGLENAVNDFAAFDEKYNADLQGSEDYTDESGLQKNTFYYVKANKLSEFISDLRKLETQYGGNTISDENYLSITDENLTVNNSITNKDIIPEPAEENKSKPLYFYAVELSPDKRSISGDYDKNTKLYTVFDDDKILNKDDVFNSLGDGVGVDYVVNSDNSINELRNNLIKELPKNINSKNCCLDVYNYEQTIKHEKYTEEIYSDAIICSLFDKTRENIIHNENDISTNFVLDKLRSAGIEVITDKNEFDKILESEELLQKMSESLTSEEKQRYFSFNEDDAKAFKNEIKEWIDHNLNTHKLIIIGTIPPIMKVLNITENLIEIEQATLDKIIRKYPIYPNDKQGHNLSVEDIYSIPNQLADPIMVFKSRTRNDSYVFLTERRDTKNRSVLIPVSVNKRKGRVIINEVTSMYGRNKEINFVISNINEAKLIYIDKKRSLEWIEKNKSFNGERESQLQLLGQRLTDIETSSINILTKENLVNFISSDNLNKKTNFQKLQKNSATYGFTHKGKIYLDPEIMNSNVTVHEYTHLWDKFTQYTNPALWKMGKDIFSKTHLWEDVKNDPNYADIISDDDLVLSECHARICGEIAEKVLQNIAERDGEIAKDAVIDWDKEVASYISESLTINDKVRLFDAALSVEDVKHFFSQPMKDLMAEKHISIEQVKNFDNEIISEKNSISNEANRDSNIKSDNISTKLISNLKPLSFEDKEAITHIGTSKIILDGKDRFQIYMTESAGSKSLNISKNQQPLSGNEFENIKFYLGLIGFNEIVKKANVQLSISDSYRDLEKLEINLKDGKKVVAVPISRDGYFETVPLYTYCSGVTEASKIAKLHIKQWDIPNGGIGKPYKLLAEDVNQFRLKLMANIVDEHIKILKKETKKYNDELLNSSILNKANRDSNIKSEAFHVFSGNTQELNDFFKNNGNDYTIVTTNKGETIAISSQKKIGYPIFKDDKIFYKDNELNVQKPSFLGNILTPAKSLEDLQLIYNFNPTLQNNHIYTNNSVNQKIDSINDSNNLVSSIKNVVNSKNNAYTLSSTFSPESFSSELSLLIGDDFSEKNILSAASKLVKNYKAESKIVFENYLNSKGANSPKKVFDCLVECVNTSRINTKTKLLNKINHSSISIEELEF